MQKANHFYGGVLGLARNPNSPDDDWVEYELEAAGVQVNEIWDSGVYHGGGLRDPDGNAILLHHRYKPMKHDRLRDSSLRKGRP